MAPIKKRIYILEVVIRLIVYDRTYGRYLQNGSVRYIMLDASNIIYLSFKYRIHMTKQQSGSMEDYLEMVAVLGKEKNIVRVTQLSTALGVNKSSVSAALTKLSKQGLVKHEKYGYVELTPEGEKIAHDVLHRHKVLEQFLVEILGVNQKMAWKDACEMEHSISPVTIQKLTMFVEYMMSKPLINSGLSQWINENSEHDIIEKDPSTTPGRIEGSNY